ncbi:MAG TPA: Yip1 family protein [Candidatus Deferrimicrobium sp.]|nr:Yip1 family protein [Candidatus Deferrimicrobium sp.]
MDFNAIIKRVIGIITKPSIEWVVIKENKLMTVSDMFLKYAIVLAAIPAIAGFIGNALIGTSYMGFTVRYPVSSALIWAIMTYIMQLVGAFLVGVIIDALATTFGAQKDMVESMKTAVFSFTAAWVSSILLIIPALGVLVMVVGGLYSLYLLYLGIKIVKNPPQDKLMGYFIVSLIITIVVFWLISFITAAVAFRGYAMPGTTIPVM